jgi:hypothetical protein
MNHILKKAPYDQQYSINLYADCFTALHSKQKIRMSVQKREPVMKIALYRVNDKHSLLMLGHNFYHISALITQLNSTVKYPIYYNRCHHLAIEKFTRLYAPSILIFRPLETSDQPTKFSKIDCRITIDQSYPTGRYDQRALR